MEAEYLTTEEAAKLTGYNSEYIRRLARKGIIEARKFGPVWQVKRSSLLDYLQSGRESADQRRGPQNGD